MTSKATKVNLYTWLTGRLDDPEITKSEIEFANAKLKSYLQSLEANEPSINAYNHAHETWKQKKRILKCITDQVDIVLSFIEYFSQVDKSKLRIEFKNSIIYFQKEFHGLKGIWIPYTELQKRGFKIYVGNF